VIADACGSEADELMLFLQVIGRVAGASVWLAHSAANTVLLIQHKFYMLIDKRHIVFACITVTVSEWQSLYSCFFSTLYYVDLSNVSPVNIFPYFRSFILVVTTIAVIKTIPSRSLKC